MSEVWLLYSTFARREEALSVARELLERRLIACANIHEAMSLYRWQGQLQQEPEAVLIAKTSGAKASEAAQVLRSLHSYEVPNISAWPVAQGSPEFMQWVQDETTAA